MLKVNCDFNDITDDDRCWLLHYEGRLLSDIASDLGLQDGSRVILFQDPDDFEVEATLLFDQTAPEYFLGRQLCARADWSTYKRLLKPGQLDICRDDLSGEQTRALLALHLAGMHENSPPDHVRALDLTGLQGPDVTVWSAWRDGHLVGIGALKALVDGTGELKSMRTHPDHLRTGVAAALLEHIIDAARMRDYPRLSLETGSGPAFDPALALYRRRGFVDGEAFSDYERSAFNQFLHLELEPLTA